MPSGSTAQVARPARSVAVSDDRRSQRSATVNTAIAKLGPALLTNGVNRTPASAAAMQMTATEDDRRDRPSPPGDQRRRSQDAEHRDGQRRPDPGCHAGQDWQREGCKAACSDQVVDGIRDRPVSEPAGEPGKPRRGGRLCRRPAHPHDRHAPTVTRHPAPVASLQAESGVILRTGARHNPAQRMTPGRNAGPTTPAGPAGERGIMTTKIRRIVRQLSLPLTVLAAALFAAGVIYGWLQYLDRSPVLEKHIPGTSAWWQQLRRFGRDSGRLWLLAPLGKPAARRAARMVPGALRGQSGFARALVALPPAGLFFYCFWRAGIQVTGGLDPNSTVNAWGGPTYLGAMACHYLDCCVLMTASAWLLDRILLPDPASARANSNAPAGSAPVSATPRPLPTEVTAGADVTPAATINRPAPGDRTQAPR